ncbi:ANTAR domain-containing protein, partial [Streptomyces sp. SID6137]|nr:ANTAR domain-containing protein [Streptomyces sp. SID6137]
MRPPRAGRVGQGGRPVTADQETPVEHEEAVPGGAAESRPVDLDGLLDERNQRLAHAGIARAEDLLLSRYRLSSREEAFDLLRRTSQRFNVKLHTLADVAVHAPAPARNAHSWMPRR